MLDQKLFLILIYTTGIILILDMLMWLIDGVTGTAVRAVYIFVTFWYYTLCPFICALWYFFADYHIKKSRAHMKKMLVPMAVPLCLNSVLAALSIKFNLLYYIDSGNVYHRGHFFLIMPVICFLYMLHTMAFVLLNRPKIQAKEYRSLLFFPVPPIIGSIIQTLFYGVSLIWICITISLLIIFINIQNDQLNTDYLTGLYNRRQLDHYLQAKKQNIGGNRFAGLMLDVNSFKAINDTYGHACGDEVLKDISKILKNSFGEKNFIARYGGDEFVVIMEIDDNNDLEAAVDKLNGNIAQFNAKKLFPFEISLSIGCDYYSMEKDPAYGFLRHIDDLMYIDKQKLKERT